MVMTARKDPGEKMQLVATKVLPEDAERLRSMAAEHEPMAAVVRRVLKAGLESLTPPPVEAPVEARTTRRLRGRPARRSTRRSATSSMLRVTSESLRNTVTTRALDQTKRRRRDSKACLVGIHSRHKTLAVRKIGIVSASRPEKRTTGRNRAA